MKVPPARYAVVKPPPAIPTRDIFEHPMLCRSTEAVIVAGSLEGTGAVDWPAGWGPGGRGRMYGRNDLQPPAQDRCPEVAQAARWLESRFGNSRMTGSGSAVFSRLDAATPEATLPADELPPGWVGRLCQGLDVHPLAGWAEG